MRLRERKDRKNYRGDRKTNLCDRNRTTLRDILAEVSVGPSEPLVDIFDLTASTRFIPLGDIL